MQTQNLRKLFVQILHHIPKLYDKELFGYAANLSFHTMLSMFPILMVSFGMFMQSDRFERFAHGLKNFLFANFMPTHQDVLSNYMEQFFSNSISLNVTGFVAVIITSIMFFNNFEYIVCKLSQSEKRRFFSSLSTYWTLMTLSPLGLGASLYAASVMQHKWELTWLANILPYILVWIIFAITYAVSINRRISTSAIIISAFISSVFWWILKIMFVSYVSYNKTYLNIYGSFSVLFFFLLWIYLSWILFLHGVKWCVLLHKAHELTKNKLAKPKN